MLCSEVHVQRLRWWIKCLTYKLPIEKMFRMAQFCIYPILRIWFLKTKNSFALFVEGVFSKERGRGNLTSIISLKMIGLSGLMQTGIERIVIG